MKIVLSVLVILAVLFVVITYAKTGSFRKKLRIELKKFSDASRRLIKNGPPSDKTPR